MQRKSKRQRKCKHPEEYVIDNKSFENYHTGDCRVTQLKCVDCEMIADIKTDNCGIPVNLKWKLDSEEWEEIDA